MRCSTEKEREWTVSGLIQDRTKEHCMKAVVEAEQRSNPQGLTGREAAADAVINALLPMIPHPTTCHVIKADIINI